MDPPRPPGRPGPPGRVAPVAPVAPAGPAGPAGPGVGLGVAWGQALLDAVDGEVAAGLFRTLGSSRMGRPIVGGVFSGVLSGALSGVGGGAQPLRGGSRASGGPRLLF